MNFLTLSLHNLPLFKGKRTNTREEGWARFELTYQSPHMLINVAVYLTDGLFAWIQACECYYLTIGWRKTVASLNLVCFQVGCVGWYRWSSFFSFFWSGILHHWRNFSDSWWTTIKTLKDKKTKRRHFMWSIIFCQTSLLWCWFNRCYPYLSAHSSPSCLWN